MALLSHWPGCAWCARLIGLCAGCLFAACGFAQGLYAGNERDLKVAFVYNFLLFTEWPAEVGPTLTVCVYGFDPFGPAIDTLQGKVVGTRRLEVQRRSRGKGDSLHGCQVVFMVDQVSTGLARVADDLRGLPVLTVADSPGAAREGCALNLRVLDNKVTFEANLQAVRAARLGLSSKLLRLATQVIQ